MSIQINVPAVVFVIIAGWIAKQFRAKIKRRKNKTSRINGKIVPLDKRNILLLIKEDISAQIERDAQRCEDDAKKKSSGD